MVVFGILKKALPLAALGLGIFALANIITKPGQASQTAGALGQTFGAFGTGLSSVGTGIGDLLGGIGGGSVRLIDPLFSLRDLFGVEAAVDPTAAKENERTESNTTIQDPV